VFRPAGDGSEIGGDFYDVFSTQPGSGWFVVGDVSGKGAGAATLTSLARYSLRAYASNTLATPAGCLTKLHAAVTAHEGERHLTAVVGTFRRDPASNLLHVTLALAGHPHPVLMTAGSPPEFVGIPGTAAGMFDIFHVTDQHLVLTEGDLLIAYTDGVTEARGDSGELFDDTRLIDLLSAEHADRDPAAIAERIATAVLDFQHGWAADDIAILTIGSPGNDKP